MTKMYRFILLHRMKLLWKRLKHGAKILLKLDKPERKLNLKLPKTKKYDGLFIDYPVLHFRG